MSLSAVLVNFCKACSWPGAFYGMADIFSSERSVDLLKHRDAHILLLNSDKYYVAVPKWNGFDQYLCALQSIDSQSWLFIRVDFSAEKTPASLSRNFFVHTIFL